MASHLAAVGAIKLSQCFSW